jgi:hypothetical protein
MNSPRARRLKAAAAAFASNAVNANLRRAQLSCLCAWTAEWAFTVALGIVAYRSGCATAVGLVGLLRMVPSAVVAPLAAPDRGRRERVLVLVSTLRGIATGAAAIVVALDGSVLIVYLLAALSTIAATLYRPAHSALLPSLCRTGHEVASANVVRGFLDSVATLIGPCWLQCFWSSPVCPLFSLSPWPRRSLRPPCCCDCATTLRLGPQHRAEST